MTYTPKFETCRLCEGKKKVEVVRQVCFALTDKPSQELKEIVAEMEADNTCPCCNGSGKVTVPPYGTGEEAQISDKLVHELAEAVTLLRCMGTDIFVEAVANQAARITLPKDVIDTYVGYWNDPNRDVNLGEYIKQIAEKAESIAIETYGSLTNGMYAGPREQVKG